MVEVAGEDPSVDELTSAVYAGNQVDALGLTSSIRVTMCVDNEDADRFADGGVSYAFVHNKGSYDATMASLCAYYPKVHYNSLMAGSGLDVPEVKRAVDDFCKDKGVPWREWCPGVWAIHHCHREGQ